MATYLLPGQLLAEQEGDRHHHHLAVVPCVQMTPARGGGAGGGGPAIGSPQFNEEIVSRFLAAQRSLEEKAAMASSSLRSSSPQSWASLWFSRLCGLFVILALVIIISVAIIDLRSTSSSDIIVGDDAVSIVVDEPTMEPTYSPTLEPSSPPTIPQSEKPHVLFILADDLGWNSMGYQDYDLSFTTPTLSSLAAKGIIMDSYYAQEVCTPSRASLLTGRYPLSVGMQYSIIMPTTSWGLHIDETTIAEVLSAEGYHTHMLGKWHLGHFDPRLLPTARGFSSFTGYLCGESYYWLVLLYLHEFLCATSTTSTHTYIYLFTHSHTSHLTSHTNLTLSHLPLPFIIYIYIYILNHHRSKKNPDHLTFVDFLTSDQSCYTPYQGDDLHTYSTFLYRDKAIEIIENHDISEPMFLYIAFQAVHDPFMDVKNHAAGVPQEYMKDGMYDNIHSEVVGHKRRQYAMALNVLDDAVEDIYNALVERGISNNTYIIFASDNGGCYLSGGKNGPLRGTKGSLFEGGSKVDAFIYSDMISEEFRGMRYTGLMHVSDW